MYDHDRGSRPEPLTRPRPSPSFPARLDPTPPAPDASMRPTPPTRPILYEAAPVSRRLRRLDRARPARPRPPRVAARAGPHRRCRMLSAVARRRRHGRPRGRPAGTAAGDARRAAGAPRRDRRDRHEPAPAQRPDLPAVVAAVRDSVVTITSEGFSSRGFAHIPSTGVGSGIVLTADGYILTNKHVVAGSQSLSVELADGEQFQATVVSSPTTRTSPWSRSTPRA